MSADDLDMEHHYDDPSSNTCKTCLQLKYDEDENDYIITQANRFYFHPYAPITEPIGGKRMRRRKSGTKKRRMSPVMQEVGENITNPAVFTDNPGF